MKIVINPKFCSLRSFIENIPTDFKEVGELVYTARNQLKSYQVDGKNIIVKRYRKPYFINRIAYTFFRPSKAKRAYEYALKLLKMEIHSPEPIAYIEERKGGLLNLSYFVSIYEKDYSVIRDLMAGTQNDPTLLKDLSFYIADLHRKGVLHLDMSPGNILYNKGKDRYKFTLIDINRMKFLPVISNEERFKSFKRLSENNEVLKEIARLYAGASKLNESETVEKIIGYSSEFFTARKSCKSKKS